MDTNDKIDRLTRKQWIIIETVAQMNTDGTFIDFDQLLERIPYATSKGSMQFSLRALIAKRFIEKAARELRRGRVRSVLAPTKKTFDKLQAASGLGLGTPITGDI